MTRNEEIEPSEPVYLIVNEEKVGFGITYKKKNSRSLVRELHGSPLEKYAKKGQDLVMLGHVQIFTDSYNINYPYNYGGVEGPPRSLSQLNKKEYYKSFIAWDLHATSKKSDKQLLPSSPIEVSRSSLEIGKVSKTVTSRNPVRLNSPQLPLTRSSKTFCKCLVEIRKHCLILLLDQRPPQQQM